MIIFDKDLQCKVDLGFWILTAVEETLKNLIIFLWLFSLFLDETTSYVKKYQLRDCNLECLNMNKISYPSKDLDLLTADVTPYNFFCSFFPAGFFKLFLIHQSLCIFYYHLLLEALKICPARSYLVWSNNSNF